MAYKEVLRVEVQEVVRRWQAGSSQRYAIRIPATDVKPSVPGLLS